MMRRSSSSGSRFDRLPLDFMARSRTSRRSSGESRFQYFRPSTLSQTMAASTLRHGTFRAAVMACRTHVGIGAVVATPSVRLVTGSGFAMEGRRGRPRHVRPATERRTTTNGLRATADFAGFGSWRSEATQTAGTRSRRMSESGETEVQSGTTAFRRKRASAGSGAFFTHCPTPRGINARPQQLIPGGLPSVEERPLDR